MTLTGASEVFERVMPLRIVMTTPSAGRSGGVEVNTYEVARELAARGHEVHLLYDEPGSLLEEYRAFCASVESMATGNPTRHRVRAVGSRLRRVSAAVKALEPSVVYVNRPNALYSTLMPARYTRTPIVCHLHGVGERRIRGTLRLVQKGVGRFVAVSDYVRDMWLQAGLHSWRCVTIHNGVSIADYPMVDETRRGKARAALGVGSGEFVLLYVGRVVAEKGVATLIEAGNTLAASGRSVVTVVAGPVPMPSYASALLDSATNGHQVRMLPEQSRVETLFHAADVSVLPAVWAEPFGRTIIESMACGVPCVASAVGGIPEVLCGPFAKLRVSPSDPQGLMGALTALEGWWRTDRQLANRCRAYVAERFALQTTVSKLEEVLAGATGGATPERAVDAPMRTPAC
jgi:glycosyltransferase involved in cell wall biosynthesis